MSNQQLESKIESTNINGKTVNVKLKENEFVAWTILDQCGLPVDVDGNIFKTKKAATEYRNNAWAGCFKSKAEMEKELPIRQYIFAGNNPVRPLDDVIEELKAKQETISKIAEIIAAAEKYKNAYFFTPPASASSRRWLEKKYSFPKVEWEEGGNTYSAWFSIECSCRNIYTYNCYTKNGKVTNLTAIRNSYKRLVNTI